MSLDFKEYQERYVNLPMHLRMCRVYDESMNEMVFMKFNQVTDKQIEECPIMLPVGIQDNEGNHIYAGDILHVEIETKYGIINRIGVVRLEGLYCCGLDYIDQEGLVSDEGDFIDEFFITKRIIIGDVYRGINQEKFNDIK